MEWQVIHANFIDFIRIHFYQDMTERPMIKVAKEDANTVISQLLRKNIIDKAYRIRRSGEHILIPLKDNVSVNGFNQEIGSFSRRQIPVSPHSYLDRERLSGSSRYFVPHKWIRLGDSIVLKSREGKIPSKRAMKAILDFTGARAVYIDSSLTKGVERKPGLRLIHGEPHELLHRENGVRYIFDPQKVMFSPGNVNVRGILRNRDLKGKTVLDMFAGIGYFAIPCAKYSGASAVYCSEINPVSYSYLLRNISLNGLDSNVKAVNSDCRNSWGSLEADLIIMGHFSSPDFLSSALLRSHEGTEIIMHVLAPTGEIGSVCGKLIEKALNMGYLIDIPDSKIIKSYSPHNWHWQITMVVFRSPQGKA